MLSGNIFNEYKTLVDQFLESTNYKPYNYSGRFLDKKIEEHIAKTKKSPIYYEPEDLADLLLDVIGIKKMATFNNYKADYRHFYDYLIGLGVVKNNICDSILLSYDIILPRMTQTAETVVLTPHDIDSICGKIQYNQTLDRAIIRTLYENICPSGADISKLTRNDVDFSRGVVSYEGYERKASDALLGLYANIGDIEFRYGPNGNKYKIFYHGDSLFPTTVQETSGNYMKRYSVFIKRELYHISEQVGININASLLHDSGMICALVRYFGKREFIRLLEDRRGRAEIKVLQETLVKFGYLPEAERVDWFRHRYVLVAKQMDDGLIEI